MPDLEIPLAARQVIAKLKRVPWVWEVILRVLNGEEAREPRENFMLRVDLIGLFGVVTDAKPKLVLKWSSPEDLSRRRKP